MPAVFPENRIHAQLAPIWNRRVTLEVPPVCFGKYQGGWKCEEEGDRGVVVVYWQHWFCGDGGKKASSLAELGPQGVNDQGQDTETMRRSLVAFCRSILPSHEDRLLTRKPRAREERFEEARECGARTEPIRGGAMPNGTDDPRTLTLNLERSS
ncbi:hypothetical protein KM043_012702 [Ampulex compressa]|nr:hypothetical protein KM043_012702 [Ampulex compressa]